MRRILYFALSAQTEAVKVSLFVLKLAPEGGAADAEARGGAGVAAFLLNQNEADVVQRCLTERIIGIDLRWCGEITFRLILQRCFHRGGGNDAAALGQNEVPDDAVQLRDIARPAVGREQGECVF